MSLREMLGVYLRRDFCMKQSEHIMINSIVPDVNTAYAREQLQRVATHRSAAANGRTPPYEVNQTPPHAAVTLRYRLPWWAWHFLSGRIGWCRRQFSILDQRVTLCPLTSEA